MTAGFQAWTDSGLVQIDGTTSNYALRQQFVVTTGGGSINAGRANNGTQYTFSANVANFTITAVTPLIALYSPDAYATILKCVALGGNNWAVQVWTNTAANVGVYVFDRASVAAPAGPGFGLQVFDAAGQLIADARQRLARIIDTQAGNINNTGPDWGQWNQVDQRTYTFGPYAGVSKIGVAAIGTAFVSAPTGGNNNGWYDISALRTVGNTVYFNYAYYSVGNTFHPSNNVNFGSQFDWRFMAVDLSNL